MEERGGPVQAAGGSREACAQVRVGKGGLFWGKRRMMNCCLRRNGGFVYIRWRRGHSDTSGHIGYYTRPDSP